MSKCIHRYKLEPPTSGKMSNGICTLCGHEKLHTNTTPGRNFIMGSGIGKKK